LDPGPSIESYPLTLNILSLYVPYLAGILLTLGFSALMSATEVAFFSLSHSELEDISISKDPVDIRMHRLIREPGKLLAAILIANNFFNVASVILLDTQSLYYPAHPLYPIYQQYPHSGIRSTQPQGSAPCD
jgi:putative hemolysin